MNYRRLRLTINRTTALLLFIAAGLFVLIAGTAAVNWQQLAGAPSHPDQQVGLTGWIVAQTLPFETIAVQPGLLRDPAGRPILDLPARTDAAGLIAALQNAAPAYCLGLNSLPWQGVENSPWFQEHYRAVYQTGAPDDPASPLTLYRYTASPFETGSWITTTVPFTVAAGEVISLTGYRLESSRLTPGALFHLTLRWETAAAIHEPVNLTLRLLDPQGEHALQHTENSLPGGLSTEYWNPGTRLEDRYIIAPPLDLKAGSYPVEITLARRNHAPVGLPWQFTLPVPPAVGTAEPAPDHPLTIALENGISLIGYDAPAAFTAGTTATLRVALYWHAAQPLPADYKVFIHLLTADNQVLAQDDAQPVAWTYPTTKWQAGEYIRDEHALLLPPDFPRGDYRIAIGIYDPATGTRLTPRDAAGTPLPDQRVILQSLPVR